MTSYIKQGETITITKENVSVTTKLAPKNYILNIDHKGNYYLNESEDFKIPDKIYGNPQEDVTRFLKTFNTMDKNLGILLLGLKGTGKTILAKILCEQAKLPVIIINSAFYGNAFNELINSIDQEVILLFDEFEKVYRHDNGYELQDKLLTLFDGTIEGAKKMFILTSNSRQLTDALIDRPGRIRYIKKYYGLLEDEIREIANDRLINKEHIDSLVKLLMFYSSISNDLVVSIIDEMNIHNYTPQDAVKLLNISGDDTFYIVKVTKDDKTYLAEQYLDITDIEEYIECTLKHVTTDGKHLGTSLRVELYDCEIIKKDNGIVHLIHPEQGLIILEKPRKFSRF